MRVPSLRARTSASTCCGRVVALTVGQEHDRARPAGLGPGEQLERVEQRALDVGAAARLQLGHAAERVVDRVGPTGTSPPNIG